MTDATGRGWRERASAAIAALRRLVEGAVATGRRLLDAAWITSLGLGVLFAGVAALAVGWRWGWDELLVLGSGLLCALALALLLAVGRTRLDVEIDLHPRRVVVGERAFGELRVRNRGRHQLLPVRLELPIGTGVGQFDLPSLGANATYDQTFVIPTSHRAVVDVGPARSVKGDPLGLVRREHSSARAATLYIHPLTVALPGLDSGVFRDLEGRATADLSPSDLAFHTLREYVPGDDRRHIHWRTSARLGALDTDERLVVRQFVDTRRTQLTLVLANSPHEFEDADEFELAVSVAGSVGRQVLQDDGLVTSVVGRRQLRSGSAGELLDALSAVALGVSAGGDVADSATYARRITDAATLLVLVTGSAAPPGTLRLAAERFGASAGTIALRVVRGARTAQHRTGGMTIVTIGDIQALPRLVGLVAAAG